MFLSVGNVAFLLLITWIIFSFLIFQIDARAESKRKLSQSKLSALRLQHLERRSANPANSPRIYSDLDNRPQYGGEVGKGDEVQKTEIEKLEAAAVQSLKELKQLERELGRIEPEYFKRTKKETGGKESDSQKSSNTDQLKDNKSELPKLRTHRTARAGTMIKRFLPEEKTDRNLKTGSSNTGTSLQTVVNKDMRAGSNNKFLVKEVQHRKARAYNDKNTSMSGKIIHRKKRAHTSKKRSLPTEVIHRKARAHTSKRRSLPKEVIHRKKRARTYKKKSLPLERVHRKARALPREIVHRGVRSSTGIVKSIKQILHRNARARARRGRKRSVPEEMNHRNGDTTNPGSQNQHPLNKQNLQGKEKMIKEKVHPNKPRFQRGKLELALNNKLKGTELFLKNITQITIRII